MTSRDLEVCGDCGVVLPRIDRPAHPYLGASPSCWALYGEVLAREYSDRELMKVHRLTVDAYAAQHPGKPGRRAIQSVWAHLGGLYLTVEKGASTRFTTRVIGLITTISQDLPWLEPPETLGSMTVADVASEPDAHAAAVRRWAADVWAAWVCHHRRVIALADELAARP
jgi:Family of unknown function (DUF5946)